MILKGVDPYRQASTTVKNRLARLVWGWVWLVFCRFSPRTFHRWRAFFLRFFGAKLGKGVHVYPNVQIWAPWNLVMDDYASMANGVICYSMAPIFLGEKVVVSQGAHLCSGTHDYTSQSFQLCAYPIHIKANAWVCTEAFIGPGVTVGFGAVIGARAVVTKDVEEWSVCAGNPCRTLKKRVMRSA
jgi:putative colanic acid biosynthesis acetyltransferase WcaF